MYFFLKTNYTNTFLIDKKMIYTKLNRVVEQNPLHSKLHFPKQMLIFVKLYQRL